MGRKMNLEFQKALEKNRILGFDKGKMLVKKELEAAKDDLDEAKNRLKNKKISTQ
jgi:hypothetical protein